jgi:hypothetical protein
MGFDFQNATLAKRVISSGPSQHANRIVNNQHNPRQMPLHKEKHAFWQK